MPHRFEDEDVVDLLEESKADNILACGFLEDFKELFPTLDLSELIDKQTGNVISLEPIKIIKAKIKACWDDNGKLLSIQWNLDGYQY